MAGVHPVAVGALAVQQPRALPGAPQRRAAGDGRRRLHRGGAAARRAATSRSSSCSARSKPRRRTSSTTSAQTLDEDYPGPDHDDEPGRGRLHDARPAPAAARAGRRARRPDAASTSCCRAASARARAEAALIAVDPQTGEILAMVGGRSYNQSQYNRAVVVAAAAGLGLQAVRLPRRRSSRPPPTGRDRHHAGLARRRRADDLRVRRPGVDAGELRAGVRRPDHLPPRARAFAQPRDRSRWPRRAGYDHVAALWKKLGVGDAAEGRTRRSRSACSRRRRSRSPRPTRSSRTWASSGRSGTSCGSTRGGKDVTKKPRSRAEARRAARHDVPRDQHDAQRASTKAPAPARAAPASRSTPPARPARPTTCATPGSSASRRSC